MSFAQPIRPRLVAKATPMFGIVASQYNQAYVQGLVNHAHHELNEIAPDSPIRLHWVAGAFEIPLIVKIIAAQKKYQAILALGVILQGETAHATLISQTVTTALQDLSLEFELPIVHGVLLLDNEDQARVRCLENEHNRGTEAARAAVSSVKLIREIGRGE